MKVCTKCNIPKDEDEFAFRNKIANKRKSLCKVCERPYKTKYYRENKKDYPERTRKKEKILKEIIQDRKKECSNCGEKEKVCLDFHHLRDKKFNLAHGSKTGSITKVLEELEKCIVLCANCHRKLHAGLINASVVQG